MLAQLGNQPITASRNPGNESLTLQKPGLDCSGVERQKSAAAPAPIVDTETSSSMPPQAARLHAPGQPHPVAQLLLPPGNKDFNAEFRAIRGGRLFCTTDAHRLTDQ